jgi:superfamily II DNA/RNA helicase
MMPPWSNLHCSNVVINYDIPWNPTRLIQRVGRVYMQRIDQSVVQAVNSRTNAVLNGLQISTNNLGLKGRNFQPPEAIRRSSAKFDLEEAVSA